MTTTQDSRQYIHRAAVDAQRSRIGKISQVYFDDQTGQPLWVLVETGLFGTRLSFMPIIGSRFDGDVVVLAVTKQQIKDAPNIDRNMQLGETEQAALRKHYSGYLGSTEESSGYGQSRQATQWTGRAEGVGRKIGK